MSLTQTAVSWMVYGSCAMFGWIGLVVVVVLFEVFSGGWIHQTGGFCVERVVSNFARKPQALNTIELAECYHCL